MKNRSIDPWLILTSTLLIVFGLIMVYSASAMKAFERTGDETYYLTPVSYTHLTLPTKA